MKTRCVSLKFQTLKTRDNRSRALTPPLLTRTAFAIGFALAHSTANSATFEVNTTLDTIGVGAGCRLRTAIESFKTRTFSPRCPNITGYTWGVGDSITFAPDLSGQTITLTGGRFTLGETPYYTRIRLDAKNLSEPLTIDADNQSRIFYVGHGSISLSLWNVILKNGSTPGNGGAILVENGGHVFLRNSEINSSTAYLNGGGIHANSSSVVDLWRSSISTNNHAMTNGGGISLDEAAELRMVESSITRNSADNKGAGIHAEGSFITLESSTISRNNAATEGGGIHIFDGGLTIESSTLFGNFAGINGGGVFASGDSLSEMQFSNSTLSRNFHGSASSAGLHLRGSNTIASLTNTVVDSYNNIILGSSCFIEEGATVIANSYNIIEDGSCGTQARAVDPRLKNISDNGGQTATVAFAPRSPARNTGDNAVCPALDQRGEPRDDGACDVGAYEFIISPSFIVVPIINSLLSD